MSSDAASPADRDARDWDPFVCARAWPKEEIWDAFEAWEPKHVADLVSGPGVVKGAYYHTLVEGLPEVYIGSGNCMAYYSARDLPGLFAFLNSPEFAAAVAEGQRWFGKFNSVDFEEITGNIYVVASVMKTPVGEPSPDDVPFVLWERFEVPAEQVGAFDQWVAREHLPALAGEPGVVRVRSLEAVREGCPLPYYYSRGNRLIMTELERFETLTTSNFLDVIRNSLAHDLKLSYVKRDVYAYRYHYASLHGGAY
jgi:hypothetical protein